MLTVQDLIEKNERDITLFCKYLDVLTARQGPPQFVGDLKRRIAEAEKSNAILRTDQYVTISNVWNEMDALPLADAHCKQYGKSARFNRMESARAIFDCKS
jgi:hypothetical protein